MISDVFLYDHTYSFLYEDIDEEGWGARTMNSLPGVSFIISHKSDKLFRFLTYMSGQQRYQGCNMEGNRKGMANLRMKLWV